MKLHTDFGVFELDEKDILVNEDPVLPGEWRGHNTRLWVIGHEYGPIVALWATCEQYALDEMLDKGYEHFLVDEPEDDPDRDLYTYLGNASEACDLSYAWIHPVKLEKERDFTLCLAFAEARGAGRPSLWG